MADGQGGWFERDVEVAIDDLTAVLIGDNLRDRRGKGKHYIGNKVEDSKLFGSSGFKHEFRDEGFQVHHAMAAIYIGFYYCPIGHIWAAANDPHPQGKALYNALCPLGHGLSLGGTFGLDMAVYRAIADPDQCKPPGKSR